MAESGARGFSLLEVLVALAILGLVLGVTYRILGGATASMASREALVRLAGFADAAWQELRLKGDIDPSAISSVWPDDVVLTLSEEPLPVDTLPEPNALRGVHLEISDAAGHHLDLHGVIRLRLRPGEGS